MGPIPCTIAAPHQPCTMITAAMIAMATSHAMLRSCPRPGLCHAHTASARTKTPMVAVISRSGSAVRVGHGAGRVAPSDVTGTDEKGCVLSWWRRKRLHRWRWAGRRTVPARRHGQNAKDAAQLNDLSSGRWFSQQLLASIWRPECAANKTNLRPTNLTGLKRGRQAD